MIMLPFLPFWPEQPLSRQISQNLGILFFNVICLMYHAGFTGYTWYFVVFKLFIFTHHHEPGSKFIGCL